MTTRSKPTAEVTIDTSVVRSLLQEQHADLAHLPLIEVGEGWDNKLFRLGGDLAVRIPRRAASATLIEHEQRWLPRLAPQLPLPVPAPLRVGRKGSGFPWSWSVVRWFPGQSALLAPPQDVATTAVALGRFLRALHQPAPENAPHNPWRGVPLAARTKTTQAVPPAARRARRPRRRAGSVGARSFDTCVVRTTIVDPRRSSPRQSTGQRRPPLGRDRLWRSRCWRSRDRPVGSLDVAAAVRAPNLLHIGARRIRSARRPHINARTRVGARAGPRVPGQLAGR